MYALSVMFDIAPERSGEFKEAALAHAANSKKNEPGCLDFAVFQSADRPDRFYFHEVYESREALEEVHNKAAYMAAFGATVRDWILRKDKEAWETPK